jgi:hypothetical protein
VMTSSSSSSIVVLHAASIADSNSNTQQVVDCLVVGIGISGSTLAHNLKKAEVDVTSYVAKSRLAMHDASRPSMPSAETTKGEKWRRYGRFSLHPSYARPSRDGRCPLSFAIFLRVENASTIERVPLWLRIFTVWTLVSVSVAAFACAVQILLLLESIPSIPTIPTIPAGEGGSVVPELGHTGSMFVLLQNEAGHARFSSRHERKNKKPTKSLPRNANRRIKIANKRSRKKRKSAHAKKRRIKKSYVVKTKRKRNNARNEKQKPRSNANVNLNRITWNIIWIRQFSKFFSR